ncbi:hypothetical protein DJ031_04635 [bacterium endosymbiont of Escarpia laminata]|nr:MAG: hypothetical protein DJ031_04635 [bacterium endosymbiont of Escarpia laminata]
MSITNLFAAEQPIIQRITDNVTGLTKVGSVSALAGFQELGLMLPGVFVMPADSVITGDPHDGGFQKESQFWLVSVLVEHQEDALGPDIDTTVKKAGEILAQTIRALVGWAPATGLQPFAYRGRPDPNYEPGYGEFPALFETGFIITGI